VAKLDNTATPPGNPQNGNFPDIHNDDMAPERVQSPCTNARRRDIMSRRELCTSAVATPIALAVAAGTPIDLAPHNPDSLLLALFEEWRLISGEADHFEALM
jgi:hypothetical protein